MPNILALWLTLSQAGANPVPATDVTAAAIQATLKEGTPAKLELAGRLALVDPNTAAGSDWRSELMLG